MPQMDLPPRISESSDTPIQAKYRQARLLLGPTSQEQICADGIGKCQFFDKGVIFWHPSIGAFFVYAGIYSKYKERHLERGPLGYPISHEQPYGNSGDRMKQVSTWNNNME